MTARRTSATGRSTARASASVTRPSRAPVRTSPVRARPRRSCSASVARASRPTSSVCRVPAEPGPAAATIRPRAVSTSATVSVGPAAGGASPDSRAAYRVRQPIPIRPCRGRPRRMPTAASASSGLMAAISSARTAVLAVRDRVAARAVVAATRSASSIASVSHRPPTPPPLLAAAPLSPSPLLASGFLVAMATVFADTREGGASGVVGGGGKALPDVAAAEQDRVHHQRMELVQPDPVAPAVREGVDLVVGRRAPGPGPGSRRGRASQGRSPGGHRGPRGR